MMGYGFGFGAILMVIFWIAIIGLAIWVLSVILPRVSSNVPPGGTAGRADRPESATEILKQRYARGEISKEQFEEMRRNLDS